MIAYLAAVVLWVAAIVTLVVSTAGFLESTMLLTASAVLSGLAIGRGERACGVEAPVRRFAVAIVVLLVACTSEPPPPSPSETPSETPSGDPVEVDGADLGGRGDAPPLRRPRRRGGSREGGAHAAGDRGGCR